MKLLLPVLILIITSCADKHPKSTQTFKNKNIPAGAFFVKGNQVDYWCEADVHSHRNNALIKVYDGATGKLVVAKRFIVICIVHGHPLWIDSLQNQIDHFDGEKFHLKRLPGQDSCWLQ